MGFLCKNIILVKALLCPRKLRVLYPLQKQWQSNASNDQPENANCYDIKKYRFPYSNEERNLILKILNTATQQDLICLKITKSLSNKLISHRYKTGKISQLYDLLDIDGMGIKSSEKLCNYILKDKLQDKVKTLNETKKVENSDEEQLVYKKRLVKPKVPHQVVQNYETFVAVTANIGFISWCHFDHDGSVINMDCHELLNPSVRLDAHRLYEKVLSIRNKIPEASFHVWEEKATSGHLQGATLGTILVALQLAQIRGILMALLDVRNTSSEFGSLYHLREFLVNRLFKLQVGSERISGLSLADRMVEGEELLEWLPPLVFQENDVQQKYLNAERTIRREMASSLFVAVAFHQTVLQRNQKALEYLMR